LAKKISKKLNIGERFTLLAILPQPGDFATYKILTKLRMTLAPDEKESAEYEFETLFRCPHMNYDEKGRREQCEFEDYSKTTLKCPIHDEYCENMGMLRWTPEMAVKEKEIWFGKKAESLIVETLTKLNDEKKLNTDIDMSLYSKFIGDDDEEEE